MFYKGLKITSRIADKLVTQATSSGTSTVHVEQGSETADLEQTEQQPDEQGPTPQKQKKKGHCCCSSKHCVPFHVELFCLFIEL